MESSNNRKALLDAVELLRNESKTDPNFFKREVFSFKGNTLEKYKILLQEVKLAYEGSDKNEKGKKLEEISSYIFNKTQIYRGIERLRDNSNEIDILLKLNDLGNILCGFDIRHITPNAIKENENIICECKNISMKVGVTWVGKFFSLLSQRNLKLGIIISYHGLAGQGEWDSSKGLTKKIFLKHGIAILDVSYTDLKSLSDIDEFGNNKSILELIGEKYDNLVYQTDISKHISKHPAE